MTLAHDVRKSHSVVTERATAKAAGSTSDLSMPTEFADAPHDDYAAQIMVAALSLPPELDEDRIDQRVFLFNKTFRDYEALLAIRGERGSPRLYFLEGTIELMSPSIDHEGIKSLIGRLVETFAEERGIDVNAFGSWTLKRRAKERGAEPDECYVLGAARKKVPDFAIEVEWTRGGLDKLEIYRKLGVREVWMWSLKRGITVHALRGERYEKVPRSELLPQLDLAELAPLLLTTNQTKTVREYRAKLRRARRRRL